MVDEDTVLIVEDEEQVADAYASQVEREYEALVAYSGEEALEIIDEHVDVVLLDRRMPGLSGDEVLDAITDDGLDCKIIIISAVDPDFDIIEMPFDEYICKPVTREDLLDAIERQLSAADHEEPLPEFLELQSKLDVLEDKKTSAELEGNEEIDEIRDRVSELEAALWNTIDEYDE